MPYTLVVPSPMLRLANVATRQLTGRLKGHSLCFREIVLTKKSVVPSETEDIHEIFAKTLSSRHGSGWRDDPRSQGSDTCCTARGSGVERGRSCARAKRRGGFGPKHPHPRTYRWRKPPPLSPAAGMGAFGARRGRGGPP